jgi:hypothetical protein
MKGVFRGRKTYATQHVMATLELDLRFTYVLAGWEGSVHGALVVADALAHERGLQVPQGNKLTLDLSVYMLSKPLPP